MSCCTRADDFALPPKPTTTTACNLDTVPTLLSGYALVNYCFSVYIFCACVVIVVGTGCWYGCMQLGVSVLLQILASDASDAPSSSEEPRESAKIESLQIQVRVNCAKGTPLVHVRVRVRVLSCVFLCIWGMCVCVCACVCVSCVILLVRGLVFVFVYAFKCT